VDRLTSAQRSWNMSRIRGRDTQPELLVRSALHRAGYRFRLHRKDLPGRPDIVLPKYRTVVFVHGCFWHRHAGCRFTYTPKSRIAFWQNKFDANVERDRLARDKLRRLGWNVATVWECQAASPRKLFDALDRVAFQDTVTFSKTPRSAGTNATRRRPYRKHLPVRAP
jgi:DNA mismatch endonuclease (patch repair protein)